MLFRYLLHFDLVRLHGRIALKNCNKVNSAIISRLKITLGQAVCFFDPAR